MKRYRRRFLKASLRQLLPFLLLLCGPVLHVRAAEQDGRWAILLAGASNDPDLQQRYLQELADLHAALVDALGFRQDRITTLFDNPSMNPALVRDKSSRAALESVCRKYAGQVGRDDLVFVFIEGHGSYDGKTYKLNLVGSPDMTADELAATLYSIPAGRFVIVNATSRSGGSVPALSQKGSVVIAATKSGAEGNLTQFGRFFVAGLKGNAADSDKNGRISMSEAFSFASRSVEEYYKNEGNLQTEHPVMDDNGDGKPQDQPAPENGEGLLARNTFLDSGTAAAPGSLTPEQQRLVREARELEKEIEALRYAKNQMPESEYEQKLEALLLKLAQINAKLPE